MLRELVVFAINSGLAVKLCQTPREEKMTAGNASSPSPTRRSASKIA